MTGSVVSWAARVSATGSRSQPGHRLSRPSMPRPNQINPAVANSESWKPTSHSTAGATSSMTSAARPSADVACARDPPSRPISMAPAMSAARTTDGLAPVSSTYPPTTATAVRAVVQRPPRSRPRGRTSARTMAETMAMFQPEMATTCVSPAVANAPLISGAIEERTPSRMPAPSAASGSGTSSFRPSSSMARKDPIQAPTPPAAGSIAALRARAMAPMPCRARYSR
jgi:hypothetical protein